jgi:hypothetical protein
MPSREDNHDNDDLIKTARLADLWSELLELRRKVRQAEAQKKRKHSKINSPSNSN